MARRQRLGFPLRQRRRVMQEVRSIVEMGLTEDESIKELNARMVMRFDPASILFSILLSWAIKQLIAWLKGKLVDQTYGDE